MSTKLTGLTLVMAGLLLAGYSSASAQEPGFDLIKSHPADVECILADDFDHDGFTDIIYTGLFYLGGTCICYGLPRLEFEAPDTLDNSISGIITTGFINNDTLLDIIVAYDNAAHVFINQGGRSYNTTVLPLTYTSLGGVTVGYFNDDSYADLIIAPNHIFYGDGTGQFPKSGSFPSNFQTVHTADLNRDNIDDVITISVNGLLRFYINDGSSNFTETDQYDLGLATLQKSGNTPLADFDHDGNTDFAFVTPHIGPTTNSMVTIGYGDGSGGIAAIDTIRILGTSYSLTITDINRDNFLDLAVSDATHADLIPLYNDGSGNFSTGTPVSFETTFITHGMATADIDRDGNPDFVSGAFPDIGLEITYDSINILVNDLAGQPVLTDVMTTAGYSNVDLAVLNPNGFEISKDYRTVAGSDYDRLDINNDNELDVKTVDYNLQYGKYEIIFRPKPGVDDQADFSADIQIGGETFVLFKDYPVPDLSADIGGKNTSDSIIFVFSYEAMHSVSPFSGQTVETIRPTFDWSGLIGEIPATEDYLFQLDDDYSFGSPNIDVSVNETNFTPSGALEKDRVYYWRITADDGGITDFTEPFAFYVSASPTDVGDDNNDVRPEKFTLYQNYPNPFNPSTTIEYTLNARADVTITVFDILGRKVRNILDQAVPVGTHTAHWNGTDANNNPVAGGVYFYQIKTGDFVKSKKMLLLK